jgi:hypothetical protein
MSLIREKTPIEKNRSLLEECILTGAEAAHHAAVVISNVNERIWGLPTDELLELLNDDVPYTLSVFSENTAISKAVNARLNKLNLPQFPTRAPTSMGRSDIELVEGVFVHIPSPAPEEPEESNEADP